ncbi:TIGR03792 family protein [cyanobiont of Ornithocercus magnificus]|nr:TIGR03792 family protein [cyanobiont of Ornithocercus magnificus]
MSAHGQQSLLVSFTALLAVWLMLSDPSTCLAASFTNLGAGYEGIVVECLRLKVTAQTRETWLEAERGSWEPWLAKQKGFLSRDLLWDPKLEEGTLLIYWVNRDAWKSISVKEVEAVQIRFEKLARQATGQQLGNPFPLLYEGELLPLS